MLGFTSVLEQFSSEIETENLSTGSPELDELIGGIRKGIFYLFYSSEKHLIETLFQHLVVNALKPNKREPPLVAYMLCGNYRKERTNLGLEELVGLLEDSGFHKKEAMKRLQIFTASSADQQVLLVDGLIKLLEGEENVSLVIVRGIFKLNEDDARVKNRHVVREEVQRSIVRLKQICAEREIPIVASCREVKVRSEILPQPESSSFLRHMANVIIYLRRRQRGSLWNRAFLVDHPALPPGSIEYHFMVNEELGRETKPFRQSYKEIIDRLRREFREPLMSVHRKNAFELLVEV
jgi:RecA/RadA recombinase